MGHCMFFCNAKHVRPLGTAGGKVYDYNLVKSTFWFFSEKDLVQLYIVSY